MECFHLKDKASDIPRCSQNRNTSETDIDKEKALFWQNFSKGKYQKQRYRMQTESLKQMED